MTRSITRLLSAAALAASCSAAFAAEKIVYVFNFDYSQVYPVPPYPDPPPPDDPEIYVGDSIRWVYFSGIHNVRSVEGSPEVFFSPNILSSQPFVHTYTHPGTHYYYCTYHGFDNADGTAGGMAGYVTVLPRPPSCPADIGSAGGTPGADGTLDNNDFIVFIDRFFAQSPAADIGSTGGVPGSDGLFDNNDFIVFIDLFFQPCP